MLFSIAGVLVLLWFLGMMTSFTMSGFLHVLLVIAIMAIVVRIIQGRRVS